MREFKKKKELTYISHIDIMYKDISHDDILLLHESLMNKFEFRLYSMGMMYGRV